MPKRSHCEKLLQAGYEVVLERGYFGASLRDIVEAACVPQGSFTNHFASKETCCLVRKVAPPNRSEYKTLQRDRRFDDCNMGPIAMAKARKSARPHLDDGHLT